MEGNQKAYSTHFEVLNEEGFLSVLQILVNRHVKSSAVNEVQRSRMAGEAQAEERWAMSLYFGREVTASLHSLQHNETSEIRQYWVL